MRWADALGATIERRWSRLERDEEALPDVAADALAAQPARDGLDLDALVDEVLDPERPATPQLAPTGAFGQPGVTVFHGNGFVVDVYFWQDGLSAIHDHPFCGAFQIVRGFSVHARHAFDDEERVGPRLRLGRLRSLGLELLGEGDLRKFSRARHPLIHTLVHVPAGAVSLVVRTSRLFGPYLRYLPPSVAVAMDGGDDRIERQLSLLDMLRRTGDPAHDARAARFVAAVDLETAFRLASRVIAEDGALPPAVADALAARHGVRAARVLEVLERARLEQAHDAERRAHSDPGVRFLVTALMCASGRAQALSLLEARWGERAMDCAAAVLDGDALFADGEEASRAVAHGLLAGDDDDALRRRLAGEFGEEAVREHEAEIASYAATSVFSVLRR